MTSKKRLGVISPFHERQNIEKKKIRGHVYDDLRRKKVFRKSTPEILHIIGKTVEEKVSAENDREHEIRLRMQEKMQYALTLSPVFSLLDPNFGHTIPAIKKLDEDLERLRAIKKDLVMQEVNPLNNEAFFVEFKNGWNLWRAMGNKTLRAYLRACNTKEEYENIMNMWITNGMEAIEKRIRIHTIYIMSAILNFFKTFTDLFPQETDHSHDLMTLLWEGAPFEGFIEHTVISLEKAFTFRFWSRSVHCEKKIGRALLHSNGEEQPIFDTFSSIVEEFKRRTSLRTKLIPNTHFSFDIQKLVEAKDEELIDEDLGPQWEQKAITIIKRIEKIEEKPLELIKKLHASSLPPADKDIWIAYLGSENGTLEEREARKMSVEHLLKIDEICTKLLPDLEKWGPKDLQLATREAIMTIDWSQSKAVADLEALLDDMGRATELRQKKWREIRDFERRIDSYRTLFGSPPPLYSNQTPLQEFEQMIAEGTYGQKTEDLSNKITRIIDRDEQITSLKHLWRKLEATTDKTKKDEWFKKFHTFCNNYIWNSPMGTTQKVFAKALYELEREGEALAQKS